MATFAAPSPTVQQQQQLSQEDIDEQYAELKHTQNTATAYCWHGVYDGFADVFDGFDEVAVADDDISVRGDVEADCMQVHDVY